MQRRSLFFSAAALALAGVGAYATTTTLQEASMAAPGKEHKLLLSKVGTWDASVQGMMGESTGTWTVRSGPGGLWTVAEFESEMMGMPFTGMEISGYDPAKGKYVSIWIDSMTTAPQMMEGVYDEASKKLTMKGEGAGMDGQPATMINVSEFKDDDTTVFTMSMEGHGGEDAPMMTIEYKRRK